MQPNQLRLDLLFTYWIGLWFVLYMLGAITTSPKFALVFITIEFLLAFVVLGERSLEFVVANLVTKLIPLCFVIHDDMTTEGFVSTFGLLCMYLVYVWLNNKSISRLYGLNGTRPFTPLSNVLHRHLLKPCQRS